MKYTPNYNFKKPDQTDSYNVDDFNGNMDILDTKVKDIEDNLDGGKPQNVVQTLLVEKWSGSEYSLEDLYPSTTYDLDIGADVSCNEEQLKAFAMAQIPNDTARNVLTAKGTVPKIAIPVAIRLWKKGSVK